MAVPFSNGIPGMKRGAEMFVSIFTTVTPVQQLSDEEYHVAMDDCEGARERRTII